MQCRHILCRTCEICDEYEVLRFGVFVAPQNRFTKSYLFRCIAHSLSGSCVLFQTAPFLVWLVFQLCLVSCCKWQKVWEGSQRLLAHRSRRLCIWPCNYHLFPVVCNMHFLVCTTIASCKNFSHWRGSHTCGSLRGDISLSIFCQTLNSMLSC